MQTNVVAEVAVLSVAVVESALMRTTQIDTGIGYMATIAPEISFPPPVLSIDSGGAWCKYQ